MPELGETWSVVETSSDQSRLEAVVIATGPTMIRLVTRSGRRITFPTGNFGLSWSLVRAAPVLPQTCARCRQAAFFRHTVGGEVVWVCEDHVPHGACAYFPGDSPGVPNLNIACPRCESKDVAVGAQLVALANDRTTARFSCNACQCAWSALLGRGLADDGAILARDLARMIDADKSVTNIWVGFVAYRSLCREMGAGDVAHMRGVPIASTTACGDLLTIVFYGTGPDNGRLPQPEEPPAITFGGRFPARDPVPGTEWSTRTFKSSQLAASCKVVSCADGVVVFERVDFNYGKGNVIRMGTAALEDFLDHWAPRIPITEQPEEWTIWRHGETRQLVQVVQATTVQAANHQVAYISVNGEQFTTPILTFRRLYRELPTPPEQHLWHKEGTLFEVGRVEASLTIEHGDGRSEAISTLDLYTRYEPMELVEAYDARASTYPGRALRSGHWWQAKQQSNLRVCILDIGVVNTQCHYVRYVDEDTHQHCWSLAAFLAEFDYEPPVLPCKAGETWVSLVDSTKQCVIVEEETAPGVVLLQSDTGRTFTLSHEALTADYRRLDIRTYWEFIDESDED